MYDKVCKIVNEYHGLGYSVSKAGDSAFIYACDKIFTEGFIDHLIKNGVIFGVLNGMLIVKYIKTIVVSNPLPKRPDESDVDQLWKACFSYLQKNKHDNLTDTVNLVRKMFGVMTIKPVDLWSNENIQLFYKVKNFLK